MGAGLTLCQETLYIHKSHSEVWERLPRANKLAFSQAPSMPGFFWLTTCIFRLNPNSSSLCCLSCGPHQEIHTHNLSRPFSGLWRFREATRTFVRWAAELVLQYAEAWWASLTPSAGGKGKHRVLCLPPQVSGCPSPERLGLGSVLFAVLCVTLACKQQRKYSLLPDCLPKTISIILAFQWMKKPFRLAQEIRFKGSVN